MLNLAMKERSPFAFRKLAPLLVLLAAAAALFGKFAVADRLEAVNRAEAELYRLREQSAKLEAATAGYSELAEEYQRYSVSWMTDAEKELLPQTDVLNLLEEELFPVGQVRRFSTSSNILTLEMDGVTLEDTSRLVQKLYQRQDVTNVEVYTASSKTETGPQAAISTVITMTQSREGGGVK